MSSSLGQWKRTKKMKLTSHKMTKFHCIIPYVLVFYADRVILLMRRIKNKFGVRILLNIIP